MMNKRIVHLVVFLAWFSTNAQDLLNILEKEHSDSTQVVEATFKTTRITFGQSLETRKKGIMDVSMFSRYWNTPEPSSQSFLADRVSFRFALEYAMTDRFTVGAGASTWDYLFDTFGKYRLVRQTKGVNSFPFSITLLQNVVYYSGSSQNARYYNSTLTDGTSDNRFSFTTQALIGSKLSRDFSVQLTPSFVRLANNLTAEGLQNVWALGFGGRYKMGNHVSLVSEYYAVFNPVEYPMTYGPFSVGVNWELGDVMLQFMLTNAVNMVESAFIGDTRYNFNFRNPNLNFGFNFTYVIHFKKALE